MFAYLSGTVAEKGKDYIILDVGGIGYDLTCSAETVFSANEAGKQEKLFCHYTAREDGVTLFGFKTPEEKSLFLHLITVSGVGPKSASQILSAAKPAALAQAIVSGNSNALTGIKGIGKKTGERIVLELKEKLLKLGTANSINALNTSQTTTNLTGIQAEAAAALMSFGLKKTEAERAILFAYQDGITLEELLKKAIQSL